MSYNPNEPDSTSQPELAEGEFLWAMDASCIRDPSSLSWP